MVFLKLWLFFFLISIMIIYNNPSCRFHLSSVKQNTNFKGESFYLPPSENESYIFSANDKVILSFFKIEWYCHLLKISRFYQKYLCIHGTCETDTSVIYCFFDTNINSLHVLIDLNNRNYYLRMFHLLKSKVLSIHEIFILKFG